MPLTPIVIGAFSLAAAIEVHQGFHHSQPGIFYGMHGAFLALFALWLAYRFVQGQTSAAEAGQYLVLVVLLYGAAATGSIVAIIAIPIVALLATAFTASQRKKPTTD